MVPFVLTASQRIWNAVYRVSSLPWNPLCGTLSYPTNGRHKKQKQRQRQQTFTICEIKSTTETICDHKPAERLQIATDRSGKHALTVVYGVLTSVSLIW